MVHTNTCPQNYKFTGYERDPETGLDYAVFRYYSARLGRFMSVDPLPGDVQNPQSLNRYAYVLNSPLDSIDPLGLDPADRDNAGYRIDAVLARWVCQVQTFGCGGGTTCYVNGFLSSCGSVLSRVQFDPFTLLQIPVVRIVGTFHVSIGIDPIIPGSPTLA